MKFLEISKAVISIIPMIIKFVKILNDIIPEAKKGKEKLVILKGIIELVLKEAEDIADDISKSVLRIVEKFVELYIKARKAIEGVF